MVTSKQSLSASRPAFRYVLKAPPKRKKCPSHATVSSANGLKYAWLESAGVCMSPPPRLIVDSTWPIDGIRCQCVNTRFHQSNDPVSENTHPVKIVVVVRGSGGLVPNVVLIHRVSSPCGSRLQHSLSVLGLAHNRYNSIMCFVRSFHTRCMIGRLQLGV